MRIVKKIFNNNIVNAVDASGDDVILVGAGVGFNTSRGKAVDESRVEREFHLTGLSTRGAFRVLLEVPYPVLRATTRVAEFLKSAHGIELTPAVEVGLADHIAQAISRAAAGTPIYNSMLWETKATYPREFAIALEAIEIIRVELNTKLPLDEAGFITLHLANAGLVGDPQRAMTLSAALRDVIDIVNEGMGLIVGDSPSSARFLTHVKFVIQGVARERVSSDPLTDALTALKNENPDVYEVASRVGDYLNRSLDSRITESERMYLLLHLLNLRENS
jgi:beta-glucoside operon transcriptional antiterminator